MERKTLQLGFQPQNTSISRNICKWAKSNCKKRKKKKELRRLNFFLEKSSFHLSNKL